MLNKRLMGVVPGCKKYIAQNVALQWCALAANIAMIFMLGLFLQALFRGGAQGGVFWGMAAVMTAAALVRFLCTKGAARAAFYASKEVKKALRGLIYRKLLRLGAAYTQSVPTAEVVQLAGEGTEQLETYFGAYLPQLFYSMLAPVTLFAALCTVSVRAAVVLMVCVPLIPFSIMAVQKFAKRLLGKYWGQYAALGDHFLENLQGLTTLKIYGADEDRHRQMNRDAEHFRRVTMKVLTMQLNSIIVMDVIAYGGAALGILVAAGEFAAGRAGFAGCLAIVLLSAEFFLPLRALGSYFHVAMNGMAASGKIFRLLDLPEAPEKTAPPGTRGGIRCEGLRFSYEAGREVLRGVDMAFAQRGLFSIVGESGCGKSTVAAVLMGRSTGYLGSVTVGGQQLSNISEAALMRHITLVSHNSYLFKGTVRSNLQLALPDAADEVLWAALEKVKLAGFLREEKGLDTPVAEGGANLSGGQRQRLTLARALLHDSPVYIFDEATSNIDVESENDIMALVHELARQKTVILISHRLANVVPSEQIYVMEHGAVVQAGTHTALLAQGGLYGELWESQQALEHVGKEAAT